MSMDNKKLTHLGIIPDGSRRWAKINKTTEKYAYMITMEKLLNFIELSIAEKIESISIYLASVDNLGKRERQEVLDFQHEEAHFVSKLATGKFAKTVRVIPVGDLDKLEEFFRKKLLDIKKLTEDNVGCTVYLLAGYDPLDELDTLIKKKPNKENIINTLSVPELVDGIIRTSGESRLSNFLPIQSGYAELIFTKKYIPDISSKYFTSLIKTLKHRNRSKGQ